MSKQLHDFKLKNCRCCLLLLLIFLVAAFLRLYLLADIPPGMTHDEADHGLDAWGVVNGIRPLYFTVGYGREPLFDYSTAVFMSFLGPTFLAGRLTSVFFSLILLAATYAWLRRAFGQREALLTMAGLGFSFWGVMTGRQALRSVAMPAFFTLAVYFYWRVGDRDWRLEIGDGGLKSTSTFNLQPSTFLSALFLGITFYTYLPARIIWLLFPGLLIFWLLFDHGRFHQMWRPTAIMLLLAGLIALPLFIHLQTNQGAEIRLTQLTGALEAAAKGDFSRIGQNIAGTFRLFTIQGDTLWRYNIPDKPLFSPVLGFLFYAGILLSLLRLRQPSRAAPYLFALAWLFVGLVPAFITGPEASVTRIIAVQPILYLFPALALTAGYDWLHSRVPARWLWWLPAFPIILFAAVFITTSRDYFITWGNHPEVRVQYETTLVTAMHYLNEQGSGVAALSNPTPGEFHSPSTALMTLRNPDVSLRWFNGHRSLLLPQAKTATLIFPGFAPLHSTLQPFLPAAAPATVLPLRDDDFDRPLTIYQIDVPALQQQWHDTFIPFPAGTIQFGDVVMLQGFQLVPLTAHAGEMVEVLTLWHIKGNQPDLKMFTHLIDPTGGEPLAQQDRLDVPSVHWSAGDQFIQLHRFPLPASLPAGEYELTVGVYEADSGVRLPAFTTRATPNNSVILPLKLQVQE